MHSPVRFMNQLTLMAAFAVALVALPGCGGSGTADTHPVNGKVTGPDGSPLSGGMVSFDGVGAKGHKATGEIGPDGSYTLSTLEPGDGAPEGEYNITVADPQGKPLKADPGKATVTADKENTIDIKTSK